MSERGRDDFRSGDALLSFDEELRILSWNRAAEELTGVRAAEAVGQTCWQVLGGVEDGGALICHAGCSNARLAREGWPVPSRELLIKTPAGRRRVSLSTIAVRDGERRTFLHLLRDGPGSPQGPPSPPLEAEDPPTLTPRQGQVLALIGDGVPAKVISSRLGLAETTVRNHIRALLLELGCHSQLEAVAKARRLRLL